MEMTYLFKNENGTYDKVTEAEWLKYMGNDEQYPYAMAVYEKQMSIEEVPESMRTEVQKIVGAKVERWGEYIPKASDTEIAEAVEGIL